MKAKRMHYDNPRVEKLVEKYAPLDVNESPDSGMVSVEIRAGYFYGTQDILLDQKTAARLISTIERQVGNGLGQKVIFSGRATPYLTQVLGSVIPRIPNSNNVWSQEAAALGISRTILDTVKPSRDKETKITLAVLKKCGGEDLLITSGILTAREELKKLASSKREAARQDLMNKLELEQRRFDEIAKIQAYQLAQKQKERERVEASRVLFGNIVAVLSNPELGGIEPGAKDSVSIDKRNVVARALARDISEKIHYDSKIPTKFIARQGRMIALKVAEVARGYEEVDAIYGISDFLKNNRSSVRETEHDFRSFKYTDDSRETLADAVTSTIHEWSQARAEQQTQERSVERERKQQGHGRSH